jgi:hypothetical protein
MKVDDKSRVFHIYLRAEQRIACDAPHGDVEAIVTDDNWRHIDEKRICPACLAAIRIRNLPA